MQFDTIHELVLRLGQIVWGEFVLIRLLAGVGVYLTIGLRCLPWRRIPYAFRLLWQGRKSRPGMVGEISPFGQEKKEGSGKNLFFQPLNPVCSQTKPCWVAILNRVRSPTAPCRDELGPRLNHSIGVVSRTDAAPPARLVEGR